MQGTSQRHPSLTDQRPKPRTEPPVEREAPSARSRASQPESRQATEDLDVQTELTELVLLFGILLGCVALAGLML